MYGTSKGLAFLHSQDLVHRDIKPDVSIYPFASTAILLADGNIEHPRFRDRPGALRCQNLRSRPSTLNLQSSERCKLLS